MEALINNLEDYINIKFISLSQWLFVKKKVQTYCSLLNWHFRMNDMDKRQFQKFFKISCLPFFF